jgi:hydroxyacylglutathione hydrolase
MFHIESFVFNPFQENTYLLYDEKGNGLIVDPGCSTPEEVQRLVSAVRTKQIDIRAIALTHAHLDHVFGVHALVQEFAVPLYAHPLSVTLIEQLPDVCRRYGIPPFHCPLPDKFLEAGDVLEVGSMRLEIVFCPGHSPDHIAFIESIRGIVIGGDLLFSGSIGRSDLPGGNHEQLLQSIRSELLVLPDYYQVYAGHGPQTTIGRERIYNPFVGVNA